MCMDGWLVGWLVGGVVWRRKGREGRCFMGGLNGGMSGEGSKLGDSGCGLVWFYIHISASMCYLMLCSVSSYIPL